GGSASFFLQRVVNLAAAASTATRKKSYETKSDFWRQGALSLTRLVGVRTRKEGGWGQSPLPFDQIAAPLRSSQKTPETTCHVLRDIRSETRRIVRRHLCPVRCASGRPVTDCRATHS